MSYVDRFRDRHKAVAKTARSFQKTTQKLLDSAELPLKNGLNFSAFWPFLGFQGYSSDR
jgi:hypothetical protein